MIEKDAINRIAWDKSLKPEEYDIYCLNRFTNELSKVNYSEIKVEGDYLVH